MDPRVLLHDEKGAGEPVVLVPGGLSGWLSWIPHQERLSQSRRVIRVQPIHNELGSAGRPGDPAYTFETEREALRMTLDELGIASADLAGWSGGARALIEFAIAYPERIRTLTLVEPAAYWILEELGESDPIVAELNEFIHPLHGQTVTGDDLAQFMVYAGFVQPGQDARQSPMWDRVLPHRMALSWQGAQMDRSGRSLEDLSSIRCPTLLCKGTVTTVWLKRVVAQLAERLPTATVLELEGDHACHIESIDIFLKHFEAHIG